MKLNLYGIGPLPKSMRRMPWAAAALASSRSKIIPGEYLAKSRQ
jgi:hypothetical protein